LWEEAFFVLRPIDSNLSILNSEQRAGQIRDPSAHHVQTLQQDEIAKRTEHEKQTVQRADRTDEDVKIKDQKDERKKDERRNKKKGNPSPDDAPDDNNSTDARSGSGFDFLA
jgi:hypothetical protein